MRTILAIDEMLAAAVRKKLVGTVELYDHRRMRKEGDRSVLCAAERGPCVLAIGGARWNPLPWLRVHRPRVPVVAVVPEATDAVIAEADILGVPFVVTVGAEAVRRISVSCRRGWLCRDVQLDPVLILPSPASRPRMFARLLDDAALRSPSSLSSIAL